MSSYFLKTGYFNIRLYFTGRVYQVIHYTCKNVDHIARETGHIRTVYQAKLNIWGRTFTGMWKMNICFILITCGSLQYNTNFQKCSGGVTAFKTPDESLNKPVQNNRTCTTHTLPLWSKGFKQKSPKSCHCSWLAKPPKNDVVYLKWMSAKAFHKTQLSSVFCKSLWFGEGLH